MRVGSRESSLPPGEGCRCASPPHFRFRNKVIPAHFSWTHTAPRPVHPRALREASLSGTGERWPGTGATRTPKARRLKLHGPGATDGVTGLFGGSAVTPCRTARRCSSPQRWIEISATGGHAEESLKTPRAGRWREGGLAGFFPELSAGPLDLAASRAPSDFFRARIGRRARMQNASRERWRLFDCLAIANERAATT